MYIKRRKGKNSKQKEENMFNLTARRLLEKEIKKYVPLADLVTFGDKDLADLLFDLKGGEMT